MADDLETGACICGNRLFLQATVVQITGPPAATETETMGDGRKRVRSEDVRKAYQCLRCGTWYFWNAAAWGWRRVTS